MTRFPSTAAAEQREAVFALLAGYRRARAEALGEGRIVSVEVDDPVLAPRDGRRRMHGLQRFVLYALDDHITRRLAAIQRRLRGDAVESGQADTELLTACEHLQASLSPVPYRRLLALLAIAVPAVALTMIGLLRGDARTSRSLGGVLTDASRLVSELAEQVLTLDITDIPTVLEEIAGRPVRTVVFVVMIILIATYLTLRPFVSSYRVKRALLCDALEGGRAAAPGRGPAAANADGAGPAPDYRTAATGVYALEARVLGGTVREAPLDLIVLALPMLFPLYIGLYIVAGTLAGEMTAARVVAGLVAATPPAARLGYLHLTARRRAANARAVPAPAPHPPAPELPPTTTAKRFTRA